MANCGPKYAVMYCDVNARCDRIVATRTNRAAAVKLAQRRNAESLAKNGGSDRKDGRPLPLYYVLRHAKRGAAD